MPILNDFAYGCLEEGPSLVFERCVDLRVAASIELPHLEGDLATFGVALSRLIPLVELVDLVVA
ncbi:hypothetical protein C480_20014 [Natrialba aegyptia DSM 13077]|uniref:Uncharacterized protein n=1 Tax=Natrialba aegyptia DSM 13077 TaxID=1227491 RepID=M0ANT3_9EURY|nr:hypothetical protein C480_20014 [Natrialba aegyptia DSM 13077]